MKLFKFESNLNSFFYEFRAKGGAELYEGGYDIDEGVEIRLNTAVTKEYVEKEKVGDTVVVLGDGLAGCECAVHLGQEGKKVHLVEMRDTLAKATRRGGQKDLVTPSCSL